MSQDESPNPTSVPRECKRGLYFNYVDKVSLKNVTLTGYEGDRITAINVGEVTEE